MPIWVSGWLFCFIVLDVCCLSLYWYVVILLVSLVHHNSLFFFFSFLCHQTATNRWIAWALLTLSVDYSFPLVSGWWLPDVQHCPKLFKFMVGWTMVISFLFFSLPPDCHQPINSLGIAYIKCGLFISSGIRVMTAWCTALSKAI